MRSLRLCRSPSGHARGTTHGLCPCLPFLGVRKGSWCRRARACLLCLHCMYPCAVHVWCCCPAERIAMTEAGQKESRTRNEGRATQQKQGILTMSQVVFPLRTTSPEHQLASFRALQPQKTLCGHGGPVWVRTDSEILHQGIGVKGFEAQGLGLHHTHATTPSGAFEGAAIVVIASARGESSCLCPP